MLHRRATDAGGEGGVTPELQKWIDSRPPAVREIATKYPPDRCYRSRENPGHYIIERYSEPQDGRPITVTIVHGRDSYMPGVAAFGIDPHSLIPCTCGNWEPPTD